jgi:hypothetical protein
MSLFSNACLMGLNFTALDPMPIIPNLEQLKKLSIQLDHIKTQFAEMYPLEFSFTDALPKTTGTESFQAVLEQMLQDERFQANTLIFYNDTQLTQDNLHLLLPDTLPNPFELIFIDQLADTKALIRLSQSAEHGTLSIESREGSLELEGSKDKMRLMFKIPHLNITVFCSFAPDLYVECEVNIEPELKIKIKYDTNAITVSINSPEPYNISFTQHGLLEFLDWVEYPFNEWADMWPDVVSRIVPFIKELNLKEIKVHISFPTRTCDFGDETTLISIGLPLGPDAAWDLIDQFNEFETQLNRGPRHFGISFWTY